MASNHPDSQSWEKRSPTGEGKRNQRQGTDPSVHPYPGREDHPLPEEPARKDMAGRSFLLGIAMILGIFIIMTEP